MLGRVEGLEQHASVMQKEIMSVFKIRGETAKARSVVSEADSTGGNLKKKNPKKTKKSSSKMPSHPLPDPFNCFSLEI